MKRGHWSKAIALVAVAGLACPALAQQAEPAAAAPDRDADIANLPKDVQAQVRCERDGDTARPENIAKLHAQLSEGYVAWVRGGVTGGFNSAGDPVGLGYGLVAEGTIGLLHPLQVNGAIRYMPNTGHHFQLDATAGFVLRSYGTEWIKAGASSSDSLVYIWSANCQVRRGDWSLIGGAKLIAQGEEPRAKSVNVFALQAGVQRLMASTSKAPVTSWSLTGLYDPVQSGIGGQFSFGAQGILIALPVGQNTYTGMSFGALLSKEYGSTPWWVTLDVGAAFEL